MKKLFLSGVGIALVLFNSFANGAAPIRKALRTQLLGASSAEAISLQATAQAFDAAVLTGNIPEAQSQLACLKALIGGGTSVVAKTDIQVQKGWFWNSTTKIESVVDGRNSLANMIDVEVILSALDFAKYQDIINTDQTAKTAYLVSYLDVMGKLMADITLDDELIRAFHKEFKTKFGELSVSGSSKTVQQLTDEAKSAAVTAASNVVLPELSQSWFGFGTKSKIGLATAVILIGLAAGKRTI